MFRSFLTLASAFAALLLATVGAQAQPRQPQSAPASAAANGIRVSEAFPYLDRYYGIPAGERSLFHVSYTIRQGGRPFTGRAWYLDAQNNRTPVPLSSEGEVGRLPTLAQLRDSRFRLQADLPPGSRVGMGLTVEPNLRPAAQLNAGDLTAVINQVNSALRSAAGLMRFMVPTMGRIAFVGARGGEVVMADGSARPLPTVRNELSFEPERYPGARGVRFASAPRSMYVARAAR